MNLPAVSSPLVSRRDFLKATVAVACAGGVLPTWAASEPAPNTAWQIGCYTRPWAEFDYRAALDDIAAAGFKFAGLMTTNNKARLVISVDSAPEEVATVANEVRQRGLKTLSIWGGSFPVEKSVEAGIAGLKKLIDDCAICGCPHLMLGGTGNAKLVQPYYQAVAECCDYAAAKNVGLSVKPHGGQNATGAQCRKLIEQVGHKNFRIWYDPGNIFYYSEGKINPVDDVSSVDGLVVGMSVKDFLPPKEVQVTPGTGRVNFREVLTRLKQGGFVSGPLIVECLTPGTERAALTAEARKARRFLEELTGQNK
jgi:sugar phosphate isomerase/epimerase